jgi:hypothetical protein
MAHRLKQIQVLSLFLIGLSEVLHGFHHHYPTTTTTTITTTTTNNNNDNNNKNDNNSSNSNNTLLLSLWLVFIAKFNIDCLKIYINQIIFPPILCIQENSINCFIFMPQENPVIPK